MIAVPNEIPTIFPSTIFTTDSLLLVYNTALLTASNGSNFTCNFSSFPIPNFVLVSSNVIPVTSLGDITFISISSFLFLFDNGVTTILAVPFFNAVTLPNSSTTTIF